jgi:hypothetical protein
LNVIFNLHGSDRPLVEEVNEAEQRLMLRRLEFHAEAKTLGAAMRQRATAPDTLLWSVATGYILGELTRKRAAPGHAGHAHEEEARPPSKLQLLLRYVAIARPIMASATSFLAPFLHRMGEQAANADAMDAQHAAEEHAAMRPSAPPDMQPAPRAEHA